MSETFVRNVGDILRSGKPIEERLEEWCNAVSGFVGGGIISVLLFDQDSEDFFMKFSTCKIRENIPGIRFASKGTLERLALIERRSIVLEERTPPKEGCRQSTFMMIPLVSCEEPVGVLVLNTVTESGFSEELQSAVCEAAKLLGDTIGSSLREESVTRRMAKIAAINEAGVNIISTLDLSQLLKLVSASACMIMEAEVCIIRLLDQETEKYGVREFCGNKTEEERKRLLLLDKKAVSHILKGEPSLLVRNLLEDEGWSEFSDAARTQICLPLKGDEGLLGTVTIIDKLTQKTFKSFFSTKDLATFSKFVQYVERAVSNAIVYARNDQLRNLDGLTGLPALKYFRSRLVNEVSRAKRLKRRLVLLVCEVRVRVNAGSSNRDDHVENYVLKQVAKTIRGTLREYDVVARINEAKFGMILPETDGGNMSAVGRTSRAIRAEVERISKKGTAVDVRFGYAVYPDDGDDQEKLIFKSNILKV